MLVQFNSDRHITATAALTEHSESSVRGALGAFADQITRVEIHVSDENGADKRGLNDKSCRIEARLSGCLLYTSPRPRARTRSRMPASA